MSGKRIAFLVNPAAGKGTGGESVARAARRLRDRGETVLELEGGSAEESLALARAAVSEDADALVACGGDGTIHLAIQAIAGTDVPLGIIPVGTGDDNARSVGLPLGDPVAAADVVADGITRRIDCGVVELTDGTRRWFMGVLSAGFDSEVTERANQMTWPKGQARYLVATLRELQIFKPVEYELVMDDQTVRQRAMLVAVGNGVSYGGGMKVCPDAKLDDGLLDVTVLGAVSKLTFIRSFPGVFKGTHVNQPYVYQYRTQHLDVVAPGQLIYADGERVGPAPARIWVEPAALRVFVRSAG